LDKFLPLKKVAVRKARRPTPWFNENISASIRAKNKAKQTFERSGSDSDRNIYRRLKNELKASICQAKIDYLKSSMAKAKSCPQMAAQIWARVNSVLGRQEVKEDNKLSLPLDVINDHFQNIAVTKQHKSAAEYDLPSLTAANNLSQFVFPEIPVSTVLSHLSSLDITKATGPDGLSACFLKENLMRLQNHLLYCIMNHSGLVSFLWNGRSLISILYIRVDLQMMLPITGQ